MCANRESARGIRPRGAHSPSQRLVPLRAQLARSPAPRCPSPAFTRLRGPPWPRTAVRGGPRGVRHVEGGRSVARPGPRRPCRPLCRPARLQEGQGPEAAASHYYRSQGPGALLSPATAFPSPNSPSSWGCYLRCLRYPSHFTNADESGSLPKVTRPAGKSHTRAPSPALRLPAARAP